MPMIMRTEDTHTTVMNQIVPSPIVTTSEDTQTEPITVTTQAPTQPEHGMLLRNSKFSPM